MTVAVRSEYSLGRLGLSGDLRLALDNEAHERLTLTRAEDGSVHLVIESTIDDAALEEALDALPDPPGQFKDLPEVVRRGGGVAGRHLVRAGQVARFLRWRFNLSGPHRAAEPIDGSRWRSSSGREGVLSSITSLVVTTRGWGMAVPSTLSDDVLADVRMDVVEPLGHELLREALDLQHSNPRAALVIGIAALEVGLKECVADLAPDTAWLVQETPTPPVVKMLVEYVPTLPARWRISGRVASPPEAALKTVRDAVHARNRLIHRGVFQTSISDLNDTLTTVRDVLYLLDVYRGRPWALNCISVSMRRGIEGELRLRR
jgi:hypothetical protein